MAQPHLVEGLLDDASTVEMAADVELTGDVHLVTAADRRVVGVRVVRGG